MAITYNVGTNTITVVGGPYGFIDIYNADVAGGWGVSFLQGTRQYLFTAKIVIGDAVNATTFLDSNKQVVFYGAGSAGGSNWLDMKSLATATFGILVNASTHATDSGIQFLFDFLSNYPYINADTGAVVDFYSCSITGVGCISRIKGNGIRRIWNFVGNRFRIGQLTTTCDLYLLYIAAPNAEYAIISSLSGTLNHIIIRGTPAYIAYLSMSSTISNLDASGATAKTFDMGGASLYVHNIINAILDAWSFRWAGGSNTILYRQYTIDLKITDKDNNNISGATVILTDKNGLEIFNLTTAADGTIATQTVSRGYYNEPNGETLQEYSPHTLTISKTGYQSYIKEFTLSEAIKWEIKLAKDMQIMHDVGENVLALKLKSQDPESIEMLIL